MIKGFYDVIFQYDKTLMKETRFWVLFRMFFNSHKTSKSVMQESGILYYLSVVGGEVVFSWHYLTFKEVCFDIFGEANEVFLENSRVSVLKYFVSFFVFEFEFRVIDKVVDISKWNYFSTYRIAWIMSWWFLKVL